MRRLLVGLAVVLLLLAAVGGAGVVFGKWGKAYRDAGLAGRDGVVLSHVDPYSGLQIKLWTDDGVEMLALAWQDEVPESGRVAQSMDLEVMGRTTTVRLNAEGDLIARAAADDYFRGWGQKTYSVAVYDAEGVAIIHLGGSGFRLPWSD